MKTEPETVETLTRRFASDAPFRKLFHCHTANPAAPEYQAALQRYLNAEFKCQADQAMPRRADATDGDAISRIMRRAV